VKDLPSMMTALPTAWTAAQRASRRTARGRTALAAPVIVLAHPDPDPGWLLSLLSASGELACTSRTGVLPLCDQAVQVWRQLEGGGPQISPFARAWVRNQVTPIVARILAGSRRSRWCEVADPAAGPAGAFGSLFPAARFVCLHRGCGDVIRAAISGSPWGPAGPGYRPYLAAYPGSTVAALAAYWAAGTEAMLEFEDEHPGTCLRIRSEDLASSPRHAIGMLNEFLGLSLIDGQPPAGPERVAGPPPSAAPVSPGCFPAEQIPRLLAAQVGDLLRELGYAALGTGQVMTG
jgi:hypothetical protein